MSMTFEDLDAWKKARELVNAAYMMTRDPGIAKDFGLSSQIQRAAVSVMSNIAEGFERQHVAEKLQAYNIARASCGEVRSLLYLIEDNHPAKANAARESRKLAGDAGSLVSGLIASTRKRLVGKIAASGVLIAFLSGIGVWLFR